MSVSSTMSLYRSPALTVPFGDAFIEGYDCGKVTGAQANSYPLAFAIAPNDSQQQNVIDLVTGLQLNQSPMTAHWLLQALALGGEPDQVVNRLTGTSGNGGWAYILANGGTFTWESWSANTDGDSQSHGWGSQALVDIIETLLGVTVSAPGAATIAITPPLLGLNHASGTVYTQRGPVTVEWTRALDGSFQLSALLPDNLRAQISVPVSGAQTVSVSGSGQATYLSSAGGYAVYDAGSGDSELSVQ
jgi:alpha-L-rhamnosidase